jgi:hypothetical protein
MDRLDRQKSDLADMRKEDWFPAAMKVMDDTTYGNSGGRSDPIDMSNLSLNENVEASHKDEDAGFKEVSVTASKEPTPTAPEAGNETKENSSASNSQSTHIPVIADNKAPLSVVDSAVKSNVVASAPPATATVNTRSTAPTFLRLNVGGMVGICAINIRLIYYIHALLCLFCI